MNSDLIKQAEEWIAMKGSTSIAAYHIAALVQRVKELEQKLSHYRSGVEYVGIVYRNITECCEELHIEKLPDSVFTQGQRVP